MDGSIWRLVGSPMFIPIAAIVFGSLIAIISIVCTAARHIAVARAREQTKRELAAYVAEGTLDADKALAMMNAGVHESADAE